MKDTLFPFVYIVARLVIFLGAIIVASGIILAGSVGYEYLRASMTTGAEWVWSAEDYSSLGGGASLVITGLFFILSAGAVKLLSAIEENTRSQRNS